MDTILSPFQPAADLLRDSRRPLILLPRGPNVDTLAAGLGLAEALRPARPETAIVSPDFSKPDGATDLLKTNQVMSNVPNLRDFIVSLDTRQVQLDALRYEALPNAVHIILTPKNGFFEARDISTSATPFMYDRIVTIGLRRLEDLGALYERQRDFFYHTQILNIDRQPENTRFGHVNAVDLTAVSQAELAAEVLLQLEPKTFSQSVATILLTGIVSATNGFQSHLVTPRTLSISAQLMAAGAQRDEIIRQLYHTKTVPVLRLWGRALSNLQSANQERIVWATLTAADLASFGTTPAQASGIVDELFVSAPKATYAALLIETPPTVTTTIIRRPGAPTIELPDEVVSNDGHHFQGQVKGTLASVEKQIIGTIRTALN